LLKVDYKSQLPVNELVKLCNILLLLLLSSSPLSSLLTHPVN